MPPPLSLLHARKLHATLLKSGHHGDAYRCNLLLRAYTRGGALADARHLLDLMPSPTLVSYNTVLSGYASSSTPGLLDAALHLLDGMPERDSWSWNTAISGLARAGRARDALRRFLQMTRTPVAPDAFTYSIVSPCCGVDLGSAGQVHARALKAGVFADACVGTSFIKLYAELGLMEDARKVFDCMPLRDLVSWNVLLDCGVRSGEAGSCMKEFLSMTGCGVRPDEFTFATVLNGLAERSAGLEAMQVHSVILKSGYLRDLFLCNCLLDVYGRCGYVDLAKKLFDAMLEKDVVSWTAVISGLAACGYQADAFDIFCQMLKAAMLPNSFTFGSIVSSCAYVNDLGSGRQCHALAVKHGLELVPIVASCFIDMYSKCAKMDDAIRMFEIMPQRDIVSWNAMICGLAQNGQSARSLELYDEMMRLHCESVTPNSVTFVGVLSACSHAGNVQKGCSYFTQMVNDFHIEPISEHYTCLIDLFARAGWLDEAEEIISNLPFKHDAVILGTMLNGCRKYGNLDMAKRFAKRLLVNNPDNASAIFLLSNMYIANEEWSNASELRDAAISSGTHKVMGNSWIDVGGHVQCFRAGSSPDAQFEHIYDVLQQLQLMMVDADKLVTQINSLCTYINSE
ncbi:pentatricopeptide repeat-containing protein At2g13600-like [Triticum dicoccoides]|uniref:pentatricopeptide repeat-containing protein At2g13600-like n=1 Tax=Triticum dicoccoides TaxID=85692 RepID=UPI00189085E1|nr:pentatricopeptide repeat-containing protein At2g13600-like [Triticum dicoccoides]